MSTSGNLAAWLLDGALASGAGAADRAARGRSRVDVRRARRPASARMSAALRGLQARSAASACSILMRDTLEAAAAILGTIHAGAVAVPVSELATPDDVQEYVLHAGAVIAITDDRARGRARRGPQRDARSARGGVRRREARRRATTSRTIVDAATPQPRGRRAGATDVVPAALLGGLGPGRAARGAALHSARSRRRASRSRSGLLQLTDAGSHPVGRAAVDRVRPRRRADAAARRRRPSRCCSRRSRTPSRCSRRCATYKPTVLFATPSVYAQLAHDAEAGKLAQAARSRCATRSPAPRACRSG